MGYSQGTIDRFMCKAVKTNSGHWMWEGARPGVKHSDRWKYGAFKLDGKVERAHRVAWMLFKGPIPEGLLVCHVCDIPLCVNPDHLFVGTHQDNMKDAMEKRLLAGKRLLPNSRPRLNDEMVRKLRFARSKGTPIGELADQYDIEVRSIQRIAKGSTRRSAGGPFTEGRVPRLSPESEEKVRRLREKGASLSQLARACRVSTWTIRRVLGEI